MIELLLGAGIVLGTQAVSTVLRRAKGPKRYKAPEPWCGCQHHYAVHDSLGVCQSGVRVMVERGKPKLLNYTTVYEHEVWETQQCACKRYTGPEPIPTMYAP